MRYANDMIVEELKNDREFFMEYLKDAINGIFSSVETAISCLMLRDIVNATIGFQALSAKIGKSDKNIMGILSKGNNPQLINIVSIINAILEHEGLTRKPVDIEQKTA